MARKPAKKERLTAKQERFVQEYLIDLNATQSAIRSGYSAKTAEVQASRLLSNAKVSNRLKVLMDRRAERTQITQDRVLKEYAKIAFSDMKDFVEWGPSGVSLKDSLELDTSTSPVVAEVSETITEHGGSKRIKLHDKVGALRDVARHLGMFIDKHEITGKDGAALMSGEFDKLMTAVIRTLDRFPEAADAVGETLAKIAKEGTDNEPQRPGPEGNRNDPTGGPTSTEDDASAGNGPYSDN